MIHEVISPLIVGSFFIPTLTNLHVQWTVHQVNWIPILHLTITKFLRIPQTLPPNRTLLGANCFWSTTFFGTILDLGVFKKHNPQSQPRLNTVSWFAMANNLGFIYKMPTLIKDDWSLYKVGFPFNWLTTILLKILDPPTSYIFYVSHVGLYIRLRGHFNIFMFSNQNIQGMSKLTLQLQIFM